jgi:hypothetical protein
MHEFEELASNGFSSIRFPAAMRSWLTVYGSPSGNFRLHTNLVVPGLHAQPPTDASGEN